MRPLTVFLSHSICRRYFMLFSGALSDDEEEESTSVVTSEFATAAPASVLKPKSAFQADQMRSAADKVKTGGANLAAAVKPKPGGKGAKK